MNLPISFSNATFNGHVTEDDVWLTIPVSVVTNIVKSKAMQTGFVPKLSVSFYAELSLTSSIKRLRI